MSLYGPTFHVTPVDLCIIFQCNLYISCIISCGNKIVSNCFKLFLRIWLGTLVYLVYIYRTYALHAISLFILITVGFTECYNRFYHYHYQSALLEHDVTKRSSTQVVLPVWAYRTSCNQKE